MLGCTLSERERRHALSAFSFLILAAVFFCHPGNARPSNLRENPPFTVSQSITEVLAKGREFQKSGKLVEACKSFSLAADLARRSKEPDQQAKALRSLSACRIRLFDYRGAQVSAENAWQLALKQNDKLTAGAAVGNLANIHSQLGDFVLADKEAEQATELLKDLPNKEYLAKALLLYANIDAERTEAGTENDQALDGTRIDGGNVARIERNYRQGVQVAHAAGLTSIEANLWEELGESLLVAHHPKAAKEPLQKAYALESANHDEDALAVNREHQAELELQNSNYTAALRLINQALASHGAYFESTPLYYRLHTKGVILAALNRKQQALLYLRKAVDSAAEWRRGALPGDTTSTRTVVLLHDVYQSYVQLAAELAVEDHDQSLARDALEALAENRAASLREQITRALGRKLELPPRYFGLLAELQAAQAQVTLGHGNRQDDLKLEQIRLEIGEVENKLGLQSPNYVLTSEKNVHRNSLRDIQRKLSDGDLLLSFSLGKDKSFLWAVTASKVNLYKLGSESEIDNATRLFAQAVEHNQDAAPSGLRLSQTLFGCLSPDLWRKPTWLVVGDGGLLDGVPFSALPDLASGRGKTPLAEAHSLRFLPGELLLLAPDPPKPQRRFLGVGDPIYNLADSRRTALLHPASNQSNPASIALSRLAGSDREVRTAAKQSGMAQTEILVGADANIANLRKSVATQPEVVHFAVHVVNANSIDAKGASKNSQAALALSLTKDEMPELLTPEAIATLRIPGSLVILSGCSSQRGDILPGAGLMGLSRAWLLAGASAVVVSAWPTPDDSGHFFSSFYNHLDLLRTGTLAERAALALDKAQMEMQRGGGYRSVPRFWAAYSIISKE